MRSPSFLNFSLTSHPLSSIPGRQTHNNVRLLSVFVSAFEIKEKICGGKMKTDLGTHRQEVDVSAIIAVGESTGSDPDYSEVKLLLDCFEKFSNVGGVMFPHIADPA
jgi:hypothetical protein